MKTIFLFNATATTSGGPSGQGETRRIFGQGEPRRTFGKSQKV